MNGTVEQPTPRIDFRACTLEGLILYPPSPSADQTKD
jgi:hypothetical protein